MACIQTIYGINNDCTPSKGGIVEVYIRAYDKELYHYAEINGEITEISNKSGWFLYQFKKNTGSMTSTLTVDQTNGVNFVETELTLVFGKMSTDKLIEINALSKSELSIIVKDSNGKYYALGIDNPVTVSSSTGQTGTQFTDGNNYTITFTDQCHTFPYLISNSAGKDLEERLKYGGPLIQSAYFTNMPKKVSNYTNPYERVTLAIVPYDATPQNQLQIVSSNPNLMKVVQIGYDYSLKKYVTVFNILPCGEQEEVTIEIKNKISGEVFSTSKTLVTPRG